MTPFPFGHVVRIITYALCKKKKHILNDSMKSIQTFGKYKYNLVLARFFCSLFNVHCSIVCFLFFYWIYLWNTKSSYHFASEIFHFCFVIKYPDVFDSLFSFLLLLFSFRRKHNQRRMKQKEIQEQREHNFVFNKSRNLQSRCKQRRRRNHKKRKSINGLRSFHVLINRIQF